MQFGTLLVASRVALTIYAIFKELESKVDAFNECNATRRAMDELCVLTSGVSSSSEEAKTTVGV